MRALQKLVRNGNATAVTLARPLLFHLGWLPGEAVIVELLEDKSVHIRRPTERDFAPVGTPRLIQDAPQNVKG